MAGASGTMAPAEQHEATTKGWADKGLAAIDEENKQAFKNMGAGTWRTMVNNVAKITSHLPQPFQTEPYATPSKSVDVERMMTNNPAPKVSDEQVYLSPEDLSSQNAWMDLTDQYGNDISGGK